MYKIKSLYINLPLSLECLHYHKIQNLTSLSLLAIVSKSDAFHHLTATLA